MGPSLMRLSRMLTALARTFLHWLEPLIVLTQGLILYPNQNLHQARKLIL